MIELKEGLKLNKTDDGETYSFINSNEKLIEKLIEIRKDYTDAESMDKLYDRYCRAVAGCGVNKLTIHLGWRFREMSDDEIDNTMDAIMVSIQEYLGDCNVCVSF